MAEVKNYPSGKNTIPEKKVESVVSGEVRTKKRNKFAETFVAEDARHVKDYLVLDVLVPAIKKAALDIVQDGIEILLYGDTRARNKSYGSRVNYTSYSTISSGRSNSRERERYETKSYTYDDIITESRKDAENILNGMFDLIDHYGMVSVADLYELASNEKMRIPIKHTDNNYGWTDLGNASVERIREGYWLKLPRAVPFD